MRRPHSFSRSAQGFTLIELMIAIVILGILLGVAVPSFQDFQANQAVRSAATELYVAMNYARSEAVKRNATVTLTSNTGGWHNGWKVMLGTEMLRDYAAKSGVAVTASATTISYSGSGRASASATWNVAASAGTATAHCVRVSGTGKPNNRKGACS